MSPPPGPADAAVPVPRGRVTDLCERYVGFAERRTGALLVGLGAVAAIALWFALRLELHTDFAELLPPDHPAVVALRGIAGRQKSATNLVMLVRSPDAAANHRFVDALRPELSRLVPQSLTEIQWQPDNEIPDYASKWRWLYADLGDLRSAESLLDRVIAKRTSPLAVDLEGDADEELRALRRRLDARLPTRDDSSRFEKSIDGTVNTGVMLWRRSEGLATRGDGETLADVKALAAGLHPERFHPQLRVEFTGAIAQAIDEQNGIRDDLTLATVLVSTMVLLAIWLYFRRLALLWVIGAPAVLGLLLALTLASVTVGYLNINTAFLISIILGNGINSPIVLLARYGEERRAGRAVAPALSAALAETLVGTITAMTAASIAYGSLLLTSFRGFSQFGLLGGAGMLLVWAMTFLLVPPMVIFGERLRPGILTPRENLWRRPFRAIGTLGERWPALPLLVACALSVAAARPLARFLRDPIEWELFRLNSEATASQRLWPVMEALGMANLGAGYIGNNGVLLVEKPEQADPVAKALADQDRARGPEHTLSEVRTIRSKLPADQDEKLTLLARIRAKLDRHRDAISDEEWRDLSGWRPPEYLRPLTLDDLPRQWLEAFTETDGTRGRLIGIDADNTVYYDWDGHKLLRMAKNLRVEALGRTWVAAATASVFAGMLETLIADGPRVTLAALLGVIALALFAFGLRGGALVLVCISVGVLWLGGLLGVFDALCVATPRLRDFTTAKINFMNFVALPITLGVGSDYAANIWARLRDGRARIREVVADTGSAVALCSATTVIGYSSLLISRNRALRSFGLVADLGELTCLTAALVVLPALARLGRRAFGRGAGGRGPDPV